MKSKDLMNHGKSVLMGMKIGASMWSFHKAAANKQMGVADFIRLAPSLGVSFIELLNIFWKEDDEEISAAKREMDRLGLMISAYDVGNDLVRRMDREYKQALNEVTRGVDVALKLDAPVVRVFGGEVKPGMSMEEAMGMIVRGLSEAADYAGQRGMKLALENHGELYGTGDRLLYIMKRVGSPHLGLNFDMGNFVISGDDANDVVEKVSNYISHVHMKDFKEVEEGEEVFVGRDLKRYVPVGPGEGRTDVAKFLRSLKNSAYQGVISIENEAYGDEYSNTMKQAEQLKGFLRAISLQK